MWFIEQLYLESPNFAKPQNVIAQCRIDSAYYNREIFIFLLLRFLHLKIASELTQLIILKSAELNAKKCWDKVAEFILNFWTAEIWNLRIFPNWTQKNCWEKVVEIDSFSFELNAINIFKKIQCRFIAPCYNNCYKQFGL